MQIHNIFRQIINWIPLFILIWPIANSYCITKNTVYPYGIGYAPIKTPHALNKPNLMILEWIRCDFFKSLAKVLWNERTALLKCQTSRPAKQELAALERIHKVDATSQANGKDYILRELASFSVPTGLCFIYPYTEGKNLAQFLSNKNWEQKANYLPQILHQTLKGLSYLQNAGIFYHDIKAHDLMVTQLSDNDVKVTIINYHETLLLPLDIPADSEMLNTRTKLKGQNAQAFLRELYRAMGNPSFDWQISYIADWQTYTEQVKTAALDRLKGMFTLYGKAPNPPAKSDSQLPDSSNMGIAKVMVPFLHIMQKYNYNDEMVYPSPDDILTRWSSYQITRKMNNIYTQCKQILAFANQYISGSPS